MSLLDSVLDPALDHTLFVNVLAASSAVLYMTSIAIRAWAQRRTRRRSGGRFYWADILLPPKIQRDLDANLDDMMPIWVKAYGHRRARRIRRWQVLRAVTGHWLTPIWLAFVKVLEIVRGK